MSRHDQDTITELLSHLPHYKLSDEKINEHIEWISKRINRKTFPVIRGLQLAAFTVSAVGFIVLVPLMFNMGGQDQPTQSNLNGSPQNNPELSEGSMDNADEEKQQGVLDGKPTIKAAFEEEFDKLPGKVKTYIKSMDGYINQYNNDSNFRERLALAAEMIPDLNENDVDALSQPITPIVPEYQRENGQITIQSPRFEAVYHEFNEAEMYGDKEKILAGLAEIGNEFYLRKDGQAVTPKGIEDFGHAKEWSTLATREDFEKVSDKVVSDTKNKLNTVKYLLPLVKKYDLQHLTEILEWTEKELKMIVEKGKIASQEDYEHYFSTGRDLFVLDDVLHQPLPVKFVQENQLSNRESVEYLLEMKKRND